VSRREAWLSAGLVFLAAAAVRAWAASQITFPEPEDTAYYVDVARNLVTGHGLTADAIWSFATPPLTFDPPRPAFEIWLPVATFLDAIPMAIAGATFAAAQASSILVGSILAVLAWRLGADVAVDLDLPPGRARTLALGSGLGAAVYLPLVLFSVQPDSTTPFAVLILGGCLVIRRIVRAVVIAPPPAPRPRLRFSSRDRRARKLASPTATRVVESRAGRWSRRFGVDMDRPVVVGLVALGALIGVAALTRNEAIYLGLVWAVVAWRTTRPASGLGRRLRAAAPLIGIPALVAIAIYLPWAVRDILAFGTALPGQALTNALFLDGRDVFAWNDPPTLDRYLAAGAATLAGLRVTALVHNVGTVLLLLGVPISALGLLALPWTARLPALRPLGGFAVTSFLVATLVFPVATTWGTFLHAAGAIHVLVVVSALVVLDGLVERVRSSQGWTRPVAWLGPAAAVATSVVLTVAIVPPQGADGRNTEALYRALPAALAAAGVPLPTDGSPVVTDFPIWLSTEDDVHAIALPNEPPSDVLDLATRFGAKLLVVSRSDDGQWPEILDQEALDAQCFRLVQLPGAEDATSPLADVAVFQIVCAQVPPSQQTP